jgi:hypothetical protein
MVKLVRVQAQLATKASGGEEKSNSYIARKFKNRSFPASVLTLSHGGKSYNTPVAYFTENIPKSWQNKKENRRGNTQIEQANMIFFHFETMATSTY